MSKTSEVKNTISSPEIHKGWEKNYRTSENEIFFEIAFESIAKSLNGKSGSTLLDAGCGSCRHSPRLAKHGMKVTAVDYSEYIVEKAKESLAVQGLENDIEVRQEDLLNFSFPDNSFDYILCWGVLMHIPEVEVAISEVSRVLKPGGVIVLSEVNMNSIEVNSIELLRPFLRKKNIRSTKTDSGLETWAETDFGRLLSRRVNIKWLETKFAEHGLKIDERRAGQFTELYTRFKSPILRKMIHMFNNFWFKNVKWPGPAFGNIIFLKKE